MTSYLVAYGWHFNRKACDYAVSMMRRNNASTGRSEKIDPYTKEQVTALLANHGVTLNSNVLYDSVYVANMCKADFLKSSVPDELHLALYIKDVIDDEDAADGTTMRRWYASMVAAGIPVDWEALL